ncbi:MAG: winged helix-turn-helix transcriptional regulator [Thermofilaceae archaeon]
MSEVRKSILKALAEEGAMSAYAVGKKIGASYSVCHAAMKLLEAEGLIRLKEVSPSLKGGITKIYSLTIEGLIEAIMAGWRGEGADRLADLDPMVFGKMGRIVGAVPRGEVAAALMYAAKKAHGLRGEEAAKAFRESFYTAPFTYAGFSRDAWINAIKGDGDLKRTVVEILREVYERGLARLRLIEEAIRVLEAD